jgi:steroid delta-isomerase-like uncharacterized protein
MQQQDIIRQLFASLLHNDVVHDVNQGGREVGKEIFLNFMERMNTCYEEKINDIVIMASPDGVHAAAEFIVEGIYLVTDLGLPKATGQRYVLPGGAFFAILGGKIARVTNYYNMSDWLKQIKA